MAAKNPGSARRWTPASPAAQRLAETVRRLRDAHPDARCALNHANPFQLLVATILSAQCTDERVNQVTPALFEKYPSVEALAAADRRELEAAIRSTGFFRQKARYLQESSQTILLNHGGQVPADMAALLALSGVARKTANVVLGVAFESAEGIVVDTHVRRLSQRLGFSEHSEPGKIERDLMALTPRADWIDLAHLLIFHGRRVCHARRPTCGRCTLSDLCPSAEIPDEAA